MTGNDCIYMLTHSKLNEHLKTDESFRKLAPVHQFISSMFMYRGNVSQSEGIQKNEAAPIEPLHLHHVRNATDALMKGDLEGFGNPLKSQFVKGNTNGGRSSSRASKNDGSDHGGGNEESVEQDEMEGEEYHAGNAFEHVKCSEVEPEKPTPPAAAEPKPIAAAVPVAAIPGPATQPIHPATTVESGAHSSSVVQPDTQHIAPAAAPVVHAVEWYYIAGKSQKVGPISEQQAILCAGNGTITRTTPVWNSTQGNNWVPASESSLGRLFATTPALPASPTPLDPLRPMPLWVFLCPGLSQYLRGKKLKGAVFMAISLFFAALLLLFLLLFIFSFIVVMQTPTPKPAIEVNPDPALVQAGSKPVFPADSARQGFTAAGNPTCEKTKDGLIWTSHNSDLPLIMTSKVPGLTKIDSIDTNSGGFIAHLEYGDIYIYFYPRLEKITPQDFLRDFTRPDEFSHALRAATYWRFADESPAAKSMRATKRISFSTVELVVDTKTRVNQLRVIGVAGLGFYNDNTPDNNCGAVFIVGLPKYEDYKVVMQQIASPHTIGPNETRMLETVQTIGETVNRMILEDMSVVAAPNK